MRERWKAEMMRNDSHHNLSQNRQNQILDIPIPRKCHYIDQTKCRINRCRFHYNRNQRCISLSVLYAQGCSKPIANGDKPDDDEKGEKNIDKYGKRPVGDGKREGDVCPQVGTG